MDVMDDTTATASTRFLPWVFMFMAFLVPFIAWSSERSWSYDKLTLLAIFPLLGLWAWSIMWTHYAYGTLRLTNPGLQKNKLYSKVSGILVLFLVLLHPFLLILNQWQTLEKLPPESVYSYAASNQKLYVFFGVVALTLFLSFEIFERLKDNAFVKRNWKWVSLSQMIAMTLIFSHALSLGSNLSVGWFELYWVTLGALLIPCFGIIGRADWQQKHYTNETPVS